jgi:acyl-CoA thioester hydrolase
MAVHGASYRVLYRDIDSMGVLYYGRYLALFEIGRVEWMRSEGCRYRDLEREHGILLPVTEAHCRYRSSIAYDDVALIRTEIVSWSGTRVRFGHRVLVPEETQCSDLNLLKEMALDDSSGRLCAEGEVELGCIRSVDHRPTRLPEPLRGLLGSVAGPAYRKR